MILDIDPKVDNANGDARWSAKETSDDKHNPLNPKETSDHKHSVLDVKARDQSVHLRRGPLTS